VVVVTSFVMCGLCVCGVVMWGCLGNMCTCIYCVLYCFLYVYLVFMILFNFVSYLFLLLCSVLSCSVYSVFIEPAGTLQLP